MEQFTQVERWGASLSRWSSAHLCSRWGRRCAGRNPAAGWCSALPQRRQPLCRSRSSASSWPTWNGAREEETQVRNGSEMRLSHCLEKMFSKTITNVLESEDSVGDSAVAERCFHNTVWYGIQPFSHHAQLYQSNYTKEKHFTSNSMSAGKNVKRWLKWIKGINSTKTPFFSHYYLPSLLA